MTVLQHSQLKTISFNQNSEYTSLLYTYISIITLILIQGYIIHTLVAETA